MCGIFGMIRSTTADTPALATEVFAALGRKAVERGRDSAGFAVTNGDAGVGSVRATRGAVDQRFATLGQVTIVKDTVSFDDLWDEQTHRVLVGAHRVAIGHTRWATQGDKSARVNASPIAVGTLVGTHNGDIETRSVPGHAHLPTRFGSTDTEWLYQALHRDRKDRRKIVSTLGAVEGRAALAWIDQDRPDRVYLGRAALSPLSIAFDADGNLYWASNPDWFRQIEDEFFGAVGFHSITMVREGTLLTVDISGEQPVLADLRQFTPTCRPSDMRLADFAVWRGFHPGDEGDDRAQSNRKVAQARVTVKTKAAKAGDVVGKSAADSAAVFTGGKRWYTPGLGDTLPGVSRIEARDAAMEPDWWQDEDEYAFYDESDEAIVMEVEDAVLRWADEGHNPEVVRRLREQATIAEAEVLMREWGLSCLDVFVQFKQDVLDWADELEDAPLTESDIVPAAPVPLSQVLAEDEALAEVMAGVTATAAVAREDVVPAS